MVDDLCQSKTDLIEESKRRASTPRDRSVKPRCISDDDQISGVRRALDSARDSIPTTDAARAVIDAIQTGLDNGCQAGLDRERELLVQLRGTPAARDALQAFFDRSKK